MINFFGILTESDDVVKEAVACRKIARRLFEIEISEKEQPVFGLENFKPTDKAAAEKHGRICKLMSRGCKNDEGITAYTEPCFVKKDEHGGVEERFLFVCTDGINSDETHLIDEKDTIGDSFPEVSCENTIDIHPYYIRTTFNKGIWLDVVTEEHWGDGVLTMPVSVKAMHNWAEHAIKEDPELFFAAVM